MDASPSQADQWISSASADVSEIVGLQTPVHNSADTALKHPIDFDVQTVCVIVTNPLVPSNGIGTSLFVGPEMIPCCTCIAKLIVG